MKRLVVSAHARADLFELWEYLAERDGIASADLMVARIYDGLARLRTTPHIGKPREELAPKVRSWNVPPYLVLYRAERAALMLVRVVHGSRDLHRLALSADANDACAANDPE